MSEDQTKDPLVSAMRGKQMNRSTIRACRMMYDLVSHSSKQVKDENGASPFAQSREFDGALKAVCIIAAIGRNEEKQSPADVMADIATCLVGDKEQRDETFAELMDKAVANASSGVNVEPYDGEEGSFPIPFSAENM